MTLYCTTAQPLTESESSLVAKASEYPFDGNIVEGDNFSLHRGNGNSPFDAIGKHTLLRTYSRHKEDTKDSMYESWEDTLRRVVSSTNTLLNAGFTVREMKEYYNLMYNLMYNLKVSVAGRVLWSLGTKTVDKLALPSRRNYAFTVVDDPIESFTWVMKFLMLGSGCVTPDTPVLTEKRGPVPIAEVKVGEKVWSYNVVTGDRSFRVVEGAHDVIVGRDENVRITTVDGTITTSKHHPILTTRVVPACADRNTISPTECICGSTECTTSVKWVYVEAGDIRENDILHKFVSEDNALSPTFHRKAWNAAVKCPPTERKKVDGVVKDVSVGDINEDVKLSYDRSYFMTFMCGMLTYYASILDNGSTIILKKEDYVLDAIYKLCKIHGLSWERVSETVVYLEASDFGKYAEFISNEDILYTVMMDLTSIQSPSSKVLSVEYDLDISEQFRDLTVRGFNSYYAGEGAFFVSHNCGFRLLPKDIDKFPAVKHVIITRDDTMDADYIVPDSREGWVKLLGKTLKAHFYGGEDFTYSCILLRSKEELIKGFEGASSGPEIMCNGIEKISVVLNSRAGVKVRPIDVLDVMNTIGQIVVAGNTRRCRPKDTLVPTSEGVKRIYQVQIGSKVVTSSGYKEVLDVVAQGEQTVIAVETGLGELWCTANHKLAVMTGYDTYAWKEAGELDSGDFLMFDTKGVIYSTPSTIAYHGIVYTNSHAWLMGLGCGCIKIYRSCSVSHTDSRTRLYTYCKEVAKKATTSLQLLGRDALQAYTVPTSGILITYDTLGTAEYVVVPGVHILDTLLCTSTSVPTGVFEGTTSVKHNYLAGLYDSMKGDVRDPSVVTPLLPVRVAKDIQTLYAVSGIATTVFSPEGPSKGYAATSRVTIADCESYNTWVEVFGGIVRKRETTNVDLPKPLYRGEWCGQDRAFLTYEEVTEITGHPPRFLPIPVYSSNGLKDIVSTYDLTVEGVHEYFCGEGVLNHNSAQIALVDRLDH